MLGSRHSRDWCFKCYFCLVAYATLIFFIFTISVFIFWLIFLPQELKFTVTDASLRKFDLTNTTPNTTLYYNLALNISIGNHNKKVGVYLSHIQAMANYGDKSFATVNNISTSFYQGHKSISTVRAVFEGHQVVVLEELELSRFNSERCAGVYNIDVKLGLWVKARYGKIETGCISPPSIDCQLKIPLSSSPNARYVGANFSVTDCGGVALPLLVPYSACNQNK
ncbi:PREDICTED: protein YLS9-like [Prunus mume]|uniref:Protein YLS9-like n=1 Tax=Prunus mume TaxID=102107 RepID=A0ABM0PLQ4_PRUMU|nr:PREDICTED: protein YLS9-like [Prunus mume]